MDPNFLTSVQDNILTPVEDHILSHNKIISSLILGNKISVHTKENGVPNIEKIDIAIIGVPENRNDISYIGEEINLSEIRKSFYTLYPGNWSIKIADFGDLAPGESVEDTYQNLTSLVSYFVKNNIIPLIIGGSQDLTYANYRAYDDFKNTINIVNVDSNFDLGDSSKPIKNNSYLGKIILEEPHNLFNYTTIGYQTYYNSQIEIDLMEKLYFEAYRLGEVCNNINSVEPVMRDADIVTIDLRSIKSSELSSRQKLSPNGFDGKEICSISRYAGISNKVSSFGIFEYKSSNEDEITEMLIAQILWYFIEGVNCRIIDDDFKNISNFQKFSVIVQKYELVFYRNVKTSRWWIEIPNSSKKDTKLKQHSLLPCTHDDYKNANEGIIPERWYKAHKKNII
ncbi:MAG: formimidoylglutamase [Flavobacteriaceae bacterium]|jgi:formiminoglutamase|nr:formimidoylglutamase [Flavobacteriaceae bacterium]MBT4113540.1 formimidoylglutamase [Flavobacteriaceae bacterium]MBT4613724.1 formimidoylglutamase [Flavobacteriaceae bacterium]MBT5246058.1 formimidoylglutamase [Flavobacteriaceae bacterium]MBT5650675.1 formimidoylglutamase [Flavobacteriaceae bacterium]